MKGQRTHYTREPLPIEDLTRLLAEGKVKRVEYPEEYKDSILIGSTQIILKDGQDFYTGPIKVVLSAIDRCGEPCKDVEPIAW